MAKKASDQADYNDIVSNLKIIRTWADVDRKYGGIMPDCCEDIVTWIDDALELLKEQQEERERIVRWLSKFCIHIDQYPNGIKCSDAERYVFFKNKMHQQFGW